METLGANLISCRGHITTRWIYSFTWTRRRFSLLQMLVVD